MVVNGGLVNSKIEVRHTKYIFCSGSSKEIATTTKRTTATWNTFHNERQQHNSYQLQQRPIPCKISCTKEIEEKENS